MNQAFITDISIFERPEKLAQSAADKILELVSRKPDAVVCMASGETPKLTNQYIVEGAKRNGTDFSRVQFISLDEWVGVPRSNAGSCYYFLKQTIFEPLNIPAGNIHFFDAMVKDLNAECEKIHQRIKKLQGIDLILVGIGLNGHIGFNEPGVDPALFAHVINLDTITLQVGQKYFSEATPIQKGITLGIAQILQSHMAILMATGQKKSAIIKKTMEESISNAVPASFIRTHKNAFVMLDADAAGLLRNTEKVF